ncbi:MAG: histidine kinase [Propioniciclava sp.]|uniref:sensor histidine kinase n=1 Tax=Propioniciclava sp. TaxID=2038686 RepID=UPI0039E58424
MTTAIGQHAEPHRFQLPEWMGRLGMAGAPEAMISLVILIYSEFFPSEGVVPAHFAFVSTLMCIFAGVTGRWPRIGTIGVGACLLLLSMSRIMPTTTLVALFIPIVSNGAHGQRSLRDASAFIYLVGGLAWTIPQAHDPLEIAQTAMIWTLVTGLAWVTGRSIDRLRSESRRQAQLRGQALRSQRRSIARDLHDTVSYATATMIMRAEQIKLRSTDPELIDDLDFIISTGRRSVRDLRGMMEALRRNDPDLEPTEQELRHIVPPNQMIREQQAELAAHGLKLQTSIEVDPDTLPTSVREALAKLVFEATTNMVKYAARGTCQLLLDIHDDAVEAVFTNQISAGDTQGRATGLGLGLVGAAERLEALGGELEADAVGGTWILRARIPLESSV